jgi:hypothetical protein
VRLAEALGIGLVKLSLKYLILGDCHEVRTEVITADANVGMEEWSVSKTLDG